MSIFLYNFFHNETNDITEKGLVRIPKDSNEWPESWKITEYKNYKLFKPIKLNKDYSFLNQLLDKRRSGSHNIIDNKIKIADIGHILNCGYGLQEINEKEGRSDHRTVPSGGKRYPLEVYVFLFKDIDGCSQGIYHYGIKNHELETVARVTFSKNDIISIIPQESLQNAIGFFCITSVFDRTVRKYGSMGYRLILLEAGHVGQNMLLAGVERSININPVAGTNYEVVEKMIGLGRGERAVYTLYF